MLGHCQECMAVMAYNEAGRQCSDCKLHQLLCASILVQRDILWHIYLPLFYSLFVFVWTASLLGPTCVSNSNGMMTHLIKK